MHKPAKTQALVALGGNRRSNWGQSTTTLQRALAELNRLPGTHLIAASRLWRTAPYGMLRQPPFTNAAALLHTSLPPHALLRHLQRLERAAGRLSGTPPWGPRTLDIDLLDHGGKVMRPLGMGRLGSARAWHRWQKRGLVLPHPGLHLRPFVLLPLVEIAPHWHHPLLHATPYQMLARLPRSQHAQCYPLRTVHAVDNVSTTS